MSKLELSRRSVLKGASIIGLAGAFPTIISRRPAMAAGTKTVRLQLSWLTTNSQIGEIVAKKLGYFEEEGIDFQLLPGGPTNDGASVVASGNAEIGQTASSPIIMLACSRGIPIKCFGTQGQQHPFAFFSLPDNPVRTAQDLVGKKIGIQATAQVLLSALLKKNNIPESAVEKVMVGGEMTPLLAGQVDVVTGWETNISARSALGPNHIVMRLWDTGVKLYSNVYFSLADSIASDPEMRASFLRAAGKGWNYVHANREKALEIFVGEVPNMVMKDEAAAMPLLMQYVFSEQTKVNGWATFDPKLWQDQIDLYADLGQFSASTPKLDDVVTTTILDMTKDARPHIG